jgi:hypothetical protein
MKRFLILAALALVTAPALATNVVVHIGDPSYYGRVDIVGYPQPQVVYAEPVVIQRATVVREPVYVRVPQVQTQNWRRYCGSYNACNRPTYFVQDTWYQDTYVPQYRDRRAQMSATSQQRLATKQAELATKTETEQQKLARKTEKAQQKLDKKAEKEQKKLDKKLGNG